MAKPKRPKKERQKKRHQQPGREDSREKEVFWAYEQIEDFRRPPFSREAQEECAALLRRLQNGEKLELPQSRPMPSIAAGCHELRVRDAEANWRLIYFLDVDVVVVLHIFAKKTQATPQSAVKLCQTRLKNYQAVRAQAERLKQRK